MEGLLAIIEAIKKLPNLSSLKCANSRVPFWPRSAGRATLGNVILSETTRRAHSSPFAHSLAGNNLTNLGRDMSG
eukprot:6641917-Prymnesium_polylepis.1